MPIGATVLQVTRSLSAYHWQQRSVDDAMVNAMVRDSAMPEILARVLSARGVTAAGADSYLNPSLKHDLPDPSGFVDMDKAAARLAQALVDGERVAVFGDYDVDGATSAALLARYFQALGRPLTVYVPDRIIEGYGPNSAALTKLFDDGHRLVVTVDCGIAAHEPLAAAKALGLDLIVVDHHLPTAALPPAFAIVNPNRADDHSAQGMLAAVGVTFMVLVAINRHLRQIDGFTRLGRAEPDLRALLDIVALGTVADVVPLTGANRALVTAGLKVLERNPKPGLSALLQVAGLEPDPARQLGVYHLGYVLGPRINAGGRVGRADLGARILASDEPVETAALAAELNHFNSERKAVEALVLDAAIDMVARTPDAPLALAVGRGWHPGVIGIVAGRLKERFRKPAFVIAMDQGVGKGSGRSVPGINLGAIVHQAVDRGLLLAGGGHAMAAGLTVEEARLDELCAFLNQAVTETSGAAPDAVLELDGVVSVAGANLALAQALQRAGPFGAGNVEPRLAIAQARVIKADIVGSNHVRCVFTGADGGRLAGIAFRAAETPLGQGLLRGIGKTMHLAGNLQIDTWQNQQRVQIQIEDAAQPS